MGWGYGVGVGVGLGVGVVVGLGLGFGGTGGRLARLQEGQRGCSEMQGDCSEVAARLQRDCGEIAGRSHRARHARGCESDEELEHLSRAPHQQPRAAPPHQRRRGEAAAAEPTC